MAFFYPAGSPAGDKYRENEANELSAQLKPGRALSSSGRSGCWKNEPICRIIALLAAFFSTAKVTNAKSSAP